MPQTDIEIARQASPLPIADIAQKLSIPSTAMHPYGNDKAKIDLEFIQNLADKPDGKLILVTAITPTPAGEGKTTTSVGLCDALNHIGKQATVCLREPSLGPCFGMKGGAAGGGYAQVIPMEDINLHFTGDFHAISAAHNLLSAMVDNHIYWGNELGIDTRRVEWGRVVDMNDRALREITVGLGGVTNGFSRTDNYSITVASEIMAIFCLATSLEDLQERIGNIIVAETRERQPIRAKQLDADGAMAVLLKDAFMPNLVQTLENNPAFIHGGPFANIAHGCNSLIATQTALKLSDYVVTEAGFGADLGAEKFFDIKCRQGDLKPDVAVIVATIRALKMHGGVEKEDLGQENVEAVVQGCTNLQRHIENTQQFGVPVIVAINRFSADSDAECQAVNDSIQSDVQIIECTHWMNGGEGAKALAETVASTLEHTSSQFQPLYELNLSLLEKVEYIAHKLYHTKQVNINKTIQARLKHFEELGYGHLPVCIAKTQYSFSTDPLAKGAPEGHTFSIREVKLSAGAQFIVVICGNIMTMPGLPKKPAATDIHLDQEGLVQGLF